MIRLERGPAPESLSAAVVQELYRDAEEHFSDEGSSARRQTFDFFWPSPGEDVVPALARTSEGRCFFCTTPAVTRDTDLEPHRLRPPQDAVAADGRTSRQHYWWLAYEWRNLYLACADCRKAQGSKFPTARRRAPVGLREDLDEREQPLVVDPVGEDPEGNFAYLDTGEVVWRTERGLLTIETFDLNRPNLIEERRASVRRTKVEIRHAASLLADDRLDEFVIEFLRLFSTNVPFAALRRQLFNQWVQVRPRKIERILDQATHGEVILEEAVGALDRITGRIKDNLSRQLYPPSEALDHRLELAEPLAHVARQIEVEEALEPMRPLASDRRTDASAYEMGREVRAVEIHNFQGIDSMDLEVAGGAGEGSWLMLLGENGAGKTAALKAIALTLMTADQRDQVAPDPTVMLRHGEKSGSIRVDLTGARNVRELHFGRAAEDHRSIGSQAPLLLAAYGATRLLPGDREASPDDRVSRTDSLFDPRFPLTRPVDWLPRLNRDQFDAVARGLQQILQLKDGEEVRRDKRHGFTIASSRGRFHLANLSDGYRTMAILALDMMNLFLEIWGQLDAAEGIVLIDEIGAHLHPRWQMKVVGAMRDTFPRVQFIATTHDPLCLRGLRDGEVVVLHRLDDGKLIAQQDGLPSIDGLTVDQLLTSEHFGLFSTLDPETEETFDRYYELLALPERDEAEEEELTVHGMTLAGSQQLGRTRRERIALEAVDAYLATERFATSAEDLRQLPGAAREGVRQILEEVEQA